MVTPLFVDIEWSFTISIDKYYLFSPLLPFPPLLSSPFQLYSIFLPSIISFTVVYQFAIPPEMGECSSFSTSLPTCATTWGLDLSHSDCYKVESQGWFCICLKTKDAEPFFKCFKMPLFRILYLALYLILKLDYLVLWNLISWCLYIFCIFDLFWM